MMQSIQRSLLAAIVVLAPLAAVAEGPAAVKVTGAYARAVPPGQPNSAAFMTLTNGSAEPRALVSASSPVAGTVELHTHSLVDGMMQMRKIERIEVPAGKTVELAPGGLHVMLIGLKQPLDPGSKVDLTLSFDDGSKAQVEAAVRTVAPMKSMQH